MLAYWVYTDYEKHKVSQSHVDYRLNQLESYVDKVTSAERPARRWSRFEEDKKENE